VESKTMNVRELRGAMAMHGVTQDRLAEAAGMARSDVSNLLHGRLSLGPRRQERLEQAIERLGLAEPAPDVPLPSLHQKEPVVFRIRLLDPNGRHAESPSVGNVNGVRENESPAPMPEKDGDNVSAKEQDRVSDCG
jgi:transcriptional regulator with XRE-family HTH domain